MPQFPEENLLATEAEGQGYFIAAPGKTLKDGRYRVIRKLGRGTTSSIFMVEDAEASEAYVSVSIISSVFDSSISQIAMVETSSSQQRF